MTDLSSDRLGANGDGFYAALTAAHEGLSLEDSAAFNARLIFILANQIGDIDVLQLALQKARA